MRRLVVGALVSLFLAGCASYEAFPLGNFAVDGAFLREEKEGIVVMARALTKEDCRRYLDRDIVDFGYQPVQLFIQNNSEKSYFFSMNRVTLPAAPLYEVAQKAHTWTATRATCYGVGALFVFPLIIPAIIDGMGSANANRALDADFSMKTASDQRLFPYSHLNKIIFVPQHEYHPYFQVGLLQEGTNEMLFLDVQVN